MDIDSNYGIRKDFLPQGKRHYSSHKQPTSQHVMMETLSSGPTIVLLIGSHTNFATFLMAHPELKKNVEHVFIMAGGVRSENPTGCCPKNATSSCISEQCGDHGNLFTAYTSNPFAEFNLFGDPFAAFQDGYTKEVSASEGVRVLVAEKAKPNKDINSTLDREYFISFLHALNSPHQTAKFNMKTEFPFYKETLYKNNIKGRLSGKPVILDLDMSPGDFVTLFYLLKMPQELIDLKGITITANGWANAATVDIIYDILHMMGRDDIPVGLGEFFALGQAYPTLNSTGDCKYRKAIPHGAGGYIDSDTLFGLARDLPRSPRRYTAHNSVKYGAPRDTEHPELRQPKAQEVLQNVMNGFESGRKVTVLTTGPLTNIATFLSSNTNSSSKIEQLYIVGGHIGQNEASDGGNVFTVLSNRKAEFNMYLDPLAAKQVLASKLNITMIPLKILRKASSFTRLLRELALAKDTPEAIFVHRLLSRMFQLHRSHHAYAHIDMFLGEVVGAAIMADRPQLKLVTQIRSVSVLANSEVGSDGWTIVDHRNGNPINLVEDIDSFAYYSHLSTILNEKNQSAIIASFSAQKKLWSTPPPQIGLPTL